MTIPKNVKRRIKRREDKIDNLYQNFKNGMVDTIVSLAFLFLSVCLSWVVGADLLKGAVSEAVLAFSATNLIVFLFFKRFWDNIRETFFTYDKIKNIEVEIYKIETKVYETEK